MVKFLGRFFCAILVSRELRSMVVAAVFYVFILHMGFCQGQSEVVLCELLPKRGVSATVLELIPMN